MTHFLADILRQPQELERTLEFLCGGGHPLLMEGATAIRRVRHVYLTGIGSSWHAALNAGSLFHRAGFTVQMRDAAELLHWDTVPQQSAIIAISRSGRSAEIVKLLSKARRNGVIVIGVTAVGDGPLAQHAQVPIVVPVGLDKSISVNTYSVLSAAASALAGMTVGSFDDKVAASLVRAAGETGKCLASWQELVRNSPWLAPRSTCYFLARTTSMGSCNEARLLWEEAVKSPATALGTGSFRHGPQEVIAENVRFGLWIDGQTLREQDLAVARDLRKLGASVMLIGQDLPERDGDLVFQIPRIPPEWQFLTDIIPAQLEWHQWCPSKLGLPGHRAR